MSIPLCFILLVLNRDSYGLKSKVLGYYNYMPTNKEILE